MKAIETHYRGRRFRSRLEARWAVFFDRMTIAWDYEPQGYDLPSGPYLPDFFLRLADPVHEGGGYWVEIKPRGDPSEGEHRRMHELCVATGHNGYVVAGNPWPGEFAWWKYSRRYDHRPDGGLICHADPRESQTWPHVPGDWTLCTDLPWFYPENAFKAAMSARFEHGEDPMSRVGDVMKRLLRGSRIGGAVRRGEVLRKGQNRADDDEDAA